MDEILFRMSNQFETFQVQTSVAFQNGQQVLSTWISEGQRLLENLGNELHSHEFKEFLQQIFIWIQKQIETINYNLSTFNFNSKYIYQQFRNLHYYALHVSKREFIYFLVGLLAGSLVGYSVALNWHTPKHLHHMKAIVCHHYLGVESVSLIDDAEMPTIQKSNELLIQVKAASIHEVDIKICSGYSRVYRRLLNTGRYKDLPVTLGRDCAGIIVDIGHNVIDFDIGDKVFLAVPSWFDGTMAEYIVVPETRVAKMPKILPFEAAASIPYSGCIAWDALINGSVIKEENAKGKRVLIYGGGTPVGCILIQLIKAWGGHIVTICQSQAAPIMTALGANEILILNESNIAKELDVRKKYDAIFYTGGQTMDEKILRKYMLPHGSYVSTASQQLVSDSLGYITGSLFSGYIRIRLLLQRIFGISTCHWKEGSKINSSFLQSLQELADTEQLQPILGKVYTADCIDEALVHVTDVNSIGSTVIKFH